MKVKTLAFLFPILTFAHTLTGVKDQNGKKAAATQKSAAQGFVGKFSLVKSDKGECPMHQLTIRYDENTHTLSSLERVEDYSRYNKKSAQYMRVPEIDQGKKVFNFSSKTEKTLPSFVHLNDYSEANFKHPNEILHKYGEREKEKAHILVQNYWIEETWKLDGDQLTHTIYESKSAPSFGTKRSVCVFRKIND
jgi:hypothetical protein